MASRGLEGLRDWKRARPEPLRWPNEPMSGFEGENPCCDKAGPTASCRAVFRQPPAGLSTESDLQEVSSERAFPHSALHGDSPSGVVAAHPVNIDTSSRPAPAPQ